MSLAQVTEYKVQVFRFKTEEKLKWKAQVIAFPQFTAEGNSREAVLEEIKDQLSTLEAESEIVNVPVQQLQPVTVEATSVHDEDIAKIRGIGKDLAAKLRALGYDHFGIFADDPGAMEVFDEIERLRDQHTVGG